MSVPFGGHPTFDRFVEWAKENGCTVETKVRTDPSGRAFTSVEMINPKGGRAAMIASDVMERLVPSQVAYLQRRLAIKTPFAATPEHADPTQTEYVQQDGMPFDPARKGEGKTPQS